VIGAGSIRGGKAMPTSTSNTSRKDIGGPKTPGGRARVAINALKHGLYADNGEVKEYIAETIGTSFEQTLDDLKNYYKPTDPVEEILVRRFARCSWRLRLLESMEDSYFHRSRERIGDGLNYENISVNERRTDIQLHRAIDALARKRKTEEENEQKK
jgi:hypothetical protein